MSSARWHVHQLGGSPGKDAAAYARLRNTVAKHGYGYARNTDGTTWRVTKGTQTLRWEPGEPPTALEKERGLRREEKAMQHWAEVFQAGCNRARQEAEEK